MVSLLVVASLVAIVSPSIIPILSLDVDTLNFIAKKPQAPTAGVCLTVTFKYCQARFAESLGLDSSVTWLNSSLLLDTFRSYADANVTEMLTLCSNRAQFAQCLGASYSSCVSLYNLLPMNGATANAAYSYTQTMHSLDFLCNTGFEESVNQYSCLQTMEFTTPYMNCISDFKTQIAGHPEKLCDLVGTTGNCLNGAYAAGCRHDVRGAGWFGCENFRGSFEEQCWEKQRCFVHDP